MENESSGHQMTFSNIFCNSNKCFTHFSFPFWNAIQTMNVILFPNQYSVPIKYYLLTVVCYMLKHAFHIIRFKCRQAH